MEEVSKTLGRKANKDEYLGALDIKNVINVQYSARNVCSEWTVTLSFWHFEAYVEHDNVQLFKFLLRCSKHALGLKAYRRLAFEITILNFMGFHSKVRCLTEITLIYQEIYLIYPTCSPSSFLGGF